MADKGKGQAIVEVEDDSDDELAYFTAKKRTYTRPMSELPAQVF